MNTKLTSAIKNFAYSFSSNIISIFINFIVLLILPKVLSVASYGYYQLYMFYSGYIGFFHFGWCDGIYLRYGGKRYKELDYSVFSFQFWALLLFEVLISSVLIIGTFLFVSETDKVFILSITILTILIVLPKTMLTYILQSTNRIKNYALVTISERVIFLSLMILLLIFQQHSYKLILLADVVGKTISLMLSIFYCRKIVTAKVCKFYLGIREAWENLKVGSKLMVANIAGTLILGVVRFAIEDNWSIEVFGKISLSITLSNMLMLFVGSVSVVLFPMLRRMENDRIKYLYAMMRNSLMIFLLGMLLLYFPVYYIISNWLPAYSDSLVYMAILFPVCIYDSKMIMLVNTYLKTLRKEKDLLVINLFTLSLSAVLTYINVIILHNLDLTVISIVILFAFRCIISELILSRYMDIKVKKDIYLELILTIVFIFSSWFIGGIDAFIIYLFAYLAYMLLKKNEIIELFKSIKKYKSSEIQQI